MKEVIERNQPGLKLAITEYNFGNGFGVTAGLAQAEALAIFGKEGVDLATRFGNFQADTPIEYAFKLYLDYDGQGSKISGSSVRTDSSRYLSLPLRRSLSFYLAEPPLGGPFLTTGFLMAISACLK
ncbi:hypothetical protein [Paenibacillus oceani]|uniref:Uncharacterized protein n=1 Tax=Paenibacillus oceani TaxID=2772510 RepID=A0A927CD67_9BACL|nr:hypothetical protein [Paenibacillus oceani]MBD2865888.1 hypothetical protein [Paenibacillus oceani]